jgi:putative phosphoesterase
MLIGLIADTHIPEAGPDIWPQVYLRFREMRIDAVLHAGDIHVLPVLDRLEQRLSVPVFACRGNGEDGSGGRPVCPEDPRLRKAWRLEWEGLSIGLCHDMEETPPVHTIERIMQRTFGSPCDVVVHGDTHVASAEVLRETLLVNPGSPMYPRNMDVSLGNIGFLRVVEGIADAWVEPLSPMGGPTSSDGPAMNHRRAAAAHPDAWVLFSAHSHDPETDLTWGTVIAAGFPREEAPALERAARRSHPAAVLVTFHTSNLPELGVARRTVRSRGSQK